MVEQKSAKAISHSENLIQSQKEKMTTRIQVIREVGLSFSSRHINCGGDVKNGICNKCRYIFKKGEVAKLTRPGEYLGVYNKETGQYEK